MSNCTPLRLGISNHVPDMQLTANIAPVTDINYLKNEYRSRRARWVATSDDDIVIEGTLDEPQVGEYFAMPGFKLEPYHTVNVKLFDSTQSSGDLLGIGSSTVGTYKPLGEWRVGVDPFAVLDASTVPDTYTLWFGRPVFYKNMRFTIGNIKAGDVIESRMIMSGQALELEKNFSYGSGLKLVTQPELVQSASGTWLQGRVQRKTKALSLSIDHATDTDISRISRMEVSLLGQPFIVSAHPGREGWQYNNYNFLARFANSNEYVHAFEGLYGVGNILFLEV